MRLSGSGAEIFPSGLLPKRVRVFEWVGHTHLTSVTRLLAPIPPFYTSSEDRSCNVLYGSMGVWGYSNLYPLPYTQTPIQIAHCTIIFAELVSFCPHLAGNWS